MKLRIRHETRYDFDGPVPSGLQHLRKTPKSFRNQIVQNWRTQITGGTRELSFVDHHRNTVELVSFEPHTTHVAVVSEGEVVVEDTQGIMGRHEGPAPLWLYLSATPQTRAGRGVNALVRQVPDGEPLDRMHTLSALIRDTVAYEIGASAPDWSAEDALNAGKGVCADHTHVFLGATRALGFPARYVSGYLMINGTEVQDATHAWAEVHLEGLGWVGFDISNGISPDDRYVRVATGLDYGEAAPLKGSRTGSADERLSVEVRVAQQ